MVLLLSLEIPQIDVRTLVIVRFALPPFFVFIRFRKINFFFLLA